MTLTPYALIPSETYRKQGVAAQPPGASERPYYIAARLMNSHSGGYTICPERLLILNNKGRGKKINANFFCTKFLKNPSGHGRPRRKSWTSAPKSAFFCGPGDGEKLFDRGKSGPESLCLCCFFFPEKVVSFSQLFRICTGVFLAETKAHQNPLSQFEVH